MPADELRRVETLTHRIGELTQQRELAIARAIDSGASWSEIARSLGCSPQAAHQRYRWLRYSRATGAVWHERPLPL